MANATSENSVGGKKLTELKVVELRSELEKRSLDKLGVKAVLLERLEKALESEGKIPGDYLFAESELKSKVSSGRLSSAMEKDIKDDEELDEASLAPPEECTDENDSTNVNSSLKIANSDKILDNEPIVDNVDKVKNDVQNIITNETQQQKQLSPEKQITLNNDLDLNNIPSQVETNDISTDSSARPPQSTSSSSSSAAAADANIKEEDMQNDADKSAMASTRDHSAPTSLNEVKLEEEAREEDSENAVCDILPPTPTSVPCVAPLTLKDTINMDTSTAQQSEENESLIVHVDDTQNDLDADLLTLQRNGLKARQAAKEKAVGKSEGKKSDIGNSGNPLEDGGAESSGQAGGMEGEVDGGGDKGNTELKTKKKADEKKDDKDGKLKSLSSVSKQKKTKNLKADGQNSRNLWISNLSPNTQVTDLKGLFSKYGKVLSAKVVVTNAHNLGERCYVFLTMSTAEEASKCIQHLNQTELHGKIITVDRSKNDLGTQTAKKAEGKPSEKKSEKLEVKKESGSPNNRNLWISGLSSNTRATDLKGLFSKYGKVVGAKVVTNARSPGARCYGFLTMSSAEEASKCIQHLNQTELHGRMISVEKAKNEPGTVKKTESKPGEKKSEKSEVKKDAEKKDGDKKEKEGVKKEEKKEINKDDKNRKSVSKKDDDKRHSNSHRKILDKSRVVVMDKSKGEPVISVKRGNKESRDKVKTSASKEKVSTTAVGKSKGTTSEDVKDKSKESKKDILFFDQIRAERERERLRQSERRLREEKRRQIRELDRAKSLQRDVLRRQKEEALRLERVRERLRMEREKLEREKLERERIKLEREYLERERIRNEHFRAEIRRFEEQRRALKRSYERSNVQEEGFWNEAKRPHLNAPSTRFEPSFSSNESRFNEFEHRDYERRVGRYDRRDARSIDTVATRFEERKDRDVARRDIGPVREIRDRDDRRPDERNHPGDRFDRREVGPGRDRSSERSHDTDCRDLGPDRGRDSERRNVSAHDRLGRVRNSPAVAPPDQRSPWGSGIDRKVDTWSHPHSNMNNGSVNRQIDRWINNNITPNHDRASGSGGFVGGSGGSGGPGAGGMVQNMGPGNMYVHPQTQPATMMVGGGGGGGGENIGGRIQEPRFDAYKHMRRY